MSKCPLCSKEITGKAVMCKQCEENLKKTHPDAKKDGSIDYSKVVIVIGALILLLFVIIMLKTFAGNFASIFQLIAIVIIIIVIMYQLFCKV